MTFLWAREKLSHKWHKVPTINGQRDKMDFMALCRKLARTWTYVMAETPPTEEICQTCATL